MPSKKREKTWKAEPHTLAKIAILKEYLRAYFPILAQSKRGRPFVYIDGFAGPGEYTNSPTGSPIAALTAVKDAMSQLGAKWVAGNVTCVFMEPDVARFEHLRLRVQSSEGNPRLTIRVKQKPFEEGMIELMREMPKPFASDDPLFVFIDPFGATGVPFTLVTRILGTDCSEILVNLDADGIARIFQAENNNNREQQLTAIFGDDSWKTELKQHEAFDMVCRRVLELYKAKLRAIPKVRYVFAFEMKGTKDRLNYHLVFASRHPLGLRKMKEAMRTIDQSGTYTFSDAGVGQTLLFRFDDPTDFARVLHSTFINRTVTYSELENFALNETPFIDPKAMLRALDSEDLLDVKSSDPKRHRGRFKEGTITSVTFLPQKRKVFKEDLFGG